MTRVVVDELGQSHAHAAISIDQEIHTEHEEEAAGQAGAKDDADDF